MRYIDHTGYVEVSAQQGLEFGIKNEIWVYQLENEILPWTLKTFHLLKIFCPNLRPLLLEGCEVKKKDDALIYAILAKLGPAYSVFVSTFHSTRKYFISQGSKYKIPSFDAFYDSLIREQEKLTSWTY